MRQILLLSVFLALAAPAAAQDGGGAGGSDGSGGMRDGLGLLGEGGRMILEGLLEQMRPMLEEVQPYFEQEVVPMLERMGEIVDDLRHYDLPERLPNGDILIRRSPEAPPFGQPAPAPTPEAGADGTIEL